VDIKQLRELLEKLFTGSIGEGDLLLLKSYLAGVVKKVSEKISTNDDEGNPALRSQNILEVIGRGLPQGERVLEYVVDELIVHLLKKRGVITGEITFSYLGQLVRNFLFDLYRKTKRSIVLVPERRKEDGEFGEGGIENEPDSKKEKNKKKVEEVRDLELIELEEVFRRNFGEDEMTYICYKLDSKRYRCFWRGKSDQAMYQEVRRKGGEVLEKLKRLMKEESVTRELFDDFTRFRLSAMCEELRKKRCEGERG
jgi:hypothetical protein